MLPRRKKGKLDDNKSPSHVSIYDKRDDFTFRIVNFQYVEDSTEHPHQTRLRVVPHFSSGIVERAFSLPAACRLFLRGVIFTRARVSLAPLSLRKNKGLLLVYTKPAYGVYLSQLVRYVYKSGQLVEVLSRLPVIEDKE